MESNIHPDLSQLQARYMQLVQAVDEQTMEINDAMSSLQAMKVIDGSGAEWSYTPAGQLVRAATPGDTPVPAEPWEFVAAQLPPRQEENQFQAPFPQQPQQFSAPQPFDPQAQNAGWPQQGMPAQGQSWPQQGGYAQPPGTPQFGAAPGGFTPGYPQQGGGGRPLPGQQQPGPSNPIVAKALALVKENSRTLIVAAVALVIIVMVAARGGGEPETTIQDPIPVAPAPQEPAPEETSPEPSPEAGPAGEQTEEPQEGEPGEEEALTAPTGDDTLAAITALTTGDRTVVSEFAIGEVEEADLRLLSAQLHGLDKAFLDLVADPAAPEGERVAVQAWRVIDVTNGQTLREYLVRWRLPEGSARWMLDGVPALR